MSILKAALSAPLRALSAAALAALLVVAPVAAQDTVPRSQRERASQPVWSVLPTGRSTSHVLELSGRTLRFTATPGSTSLEGADRSTLADVAWVAYTLDGADPAKRPVVFAFNGGPGSSSVWLHLGTLGPWRLPLTADVIAGRTPVELVENAETWLDLADLVFIDPPGTGFSRIWPGVGPRMSPGAAHEMSRPATADEQQSAAVREQGASRMTGGPAWFWSVRGDIDTFAETIKSWLDRHGRIGSPVVLVGESYGGFRGPLIADRLAEEHKISVAAMVLVSPVLDFDGRRGWRTPISHVALLPSIAATRLERTGTTPTRAALVEAETYAGGAYLADLMRGPRDSAALARISERVSALSGISREAAQGHLGRLTIGAFLQDSPDLRGRGVSIYDAGMPGLEPSRGGRRGGFDDPFTGGLDQPLATAMAALNARLDWRPDRAYVVMSRETNRRWRWPNAPSPPQALATLHHLHSKDARLRTLVTHGFTDLVTPYFASALQLEQLPAHGSQQRITLQVYPGGHMYYSRDQSRAQFRADAGKVIGEALGWPEAQKQDNRGETP